MTRIDSSLRVAAGVIAIGSAAIAAWLALVLVTVVPARDPDGVGLWSGILVLLMTLVGLTVAGLVTTDPARWSGLDLVVGIVAIGVGAWMVAASFTGRSDDVYSVIIGAWLVIHGTALVALSRSLSPSARHRPG